MIKLLTRVPFVFMSDVCETVVIERNGEPVTINKSDYKEDRDGKLFEGNDKFNADGTLRKGANAEMHVAKVTADPNAGKPGTDDDDADDIRTAKLGVTTKKGKFIVVNTETGKPFHHQGIATAYPDNASAWKAISDAQAAANNNSGGDANSSNANPAGGSPQ